MKNMETFLEKIRIMASKISLSGNEKNAIRNKLTLFIKANRVRPNWQKRAALALANSFWNFRDLAPATKYGVSLAAILFFVATSVSFGAEGALPGEPLYSIKINVNEKVRSLLAISDVSKASWEVEAASRRLEEAEQLAIRGNLSREAQNEIEDSFDKSFKAAREKIQNIAGANKSSEAQNISDYFKAKLEAHEQVLTKIADQKEGARPQLNSILNKVRERKNSIKKSRENFGEDDPKPTSVNPLRVDGVGGGDEEDDSSRGELDD